MESAIMVGDLIQQRLDEFTERLCAEIREIDDTTDDSVEPSASAIRSKFFHELVRKTGNFGSVKWLGHPIWQNILDLWTIQETISEVRPQLLIECGTNRGGSSLFFAHLFDLMAAGEVITVDVERMHELAHPRVTYLIGDSTSSEILETIRSKAATCAGPIMVILDSDHSQAHVRRELECYAPLVTPGSYCLVQDGVIDMLPVFSSGRPGPLPAIEDFLASTDDFELDEERCERFLITHHPKGWLRRKSNDAVARPHILTSLPQSQHPSIA